VDDLLDRLDAGLQPPTGVPEPRWWARSKVQDDGWSDGEELALFSLGER
jgi:hypothetical protein